MQINIIKLEGDEWSISLDFDNHDPSDQNMRMCVEGLSLISNPDLLDEAIHQIKNIFGDEFAKRTKSIFENAKRLMSMTFESGSDQRIVYSIPAVDTIFVEGAGN